MVFGRNLHLIGPFEAFGAGFAQNVAAHLLYFQAPGPFFGPRGRILDPGSDLGIFRSTFWPGDVFGVIWGSRKTFVCEGKVLWLGYRGFRVTQMNCMVLRTHLGVLLCPTKHLIQ